MNSISPLVLQNASLGQMFYSAAAKRHWEKRHQQTSVVEKHSWRYQTVLFGKALE